MRRASAVVALDPPRTASPSSDQTSAMIIRTNSHSRLPLQASVRTSPNPIMAGGHTPAIAPLIETAFAASANSDFRHGHSVSRWKCCMLLGSRCAATASPLPGRSAVRGDPGCGITYEGSHLLSPKFSSRLHSSIVSMAHVATRYEHRTFLAFFAVERREFCKAQCGLRDNSRNRAQTCGLLWKTQRSAGIARGRTLAPLDRTAVRHPILFSSRVP